MKIEVALITALAVALGKSDRTESEGAQKEGGRLHASKFHRI
jgi:hypothetical protein